MIRTLLLTVLILLGAAESGSGQIKPDVKLPTDPRCELRYDGKPFTYWENFPRTELKAEKRIDALHAMAAFGIRGYPREATAAIVELLKEYDNDEDAFRIDLYAPEKGTPDQRIIHEALWSLRKIGSETSAVLLAHLDHKAVRRIATELYLWPRYTEYFPVAITESSVPLLVRWIQSKGDETRNLAIDILGKAIDREPEGKKEKSYQAMFLQTVAKEKKELVIVDALTQGLLQGGWTRETSALLLAWIPIGG